MCFVPYPMVEEGSYRSFDQTYGQDTNELSRPSLQSSGKPQKTKRDIKYKSVFVAGMIPFLRISIAVYLLKALFLLQAVALLL